MIQRIQEPSGRNIQVRFARTLDEKLNVFKHRYYRHALGIGRDKDLANHDLKILTDHLDDTAAIVAAFDEDRVVGSGRVNFSYLVEFPEDEPYGFAQYEARFPGQLSLTSKVTVAPQYRNSLILLEMACLILKEASKRSMMRHFIRTPDQFVPLFKMLGFVTYRPRLKQSPEYEASNLLILNPFDLKHLESVRSPFLEDAVQFCEKYESIRKARQFSHTQLVSANWPTPANKTRH